MPPRTGKSIDSKVCPRCKLDKPRSQFHKSKRNGVQGVCSDCLPHRGREQKLKQRYDLTPEQHAAMVRLQAGVCAICDEPTQAIDHDHYTGKVRGLLCNLCNRGLGHFRDNPKLLRSAAKYLEKHAPV